MARGKYSPTVVAAYRSDQSWFSKYSRGQNFDPEGYDSYGYNQDSRDRAGNDELDYLRNDADWDTDSDYNILYDDALDLWGFDGVQPVRS
jgi:hypothetical protein